MSKKDLYAFILLSCYRDIISIISNFDIVYAVVLKLANCIKLGWEILYVYDTFIIPITLITMNNL